MTDAIAPSASIVTAYKAYANASAPSQATPAADKGQADSFGPAVKTGTPPLSAAVLSAMDQTARDTAPSTYDAAGNLQKLGG